ncbi:MAG: choice-of-anchor B family protein [Flavobacteriales bacterium]|nr:choice-of-anchor B family protein [Flavobacteriales bacterium]
MNMLRNTLLLAGLCFALLVRSQDSLNVHLLFHWDPDSIPGSAAFDNQYDDVWGYAQDGSEYAIIGSSLGTHIFDVTDAVNGHQVAFIPGAVQGPMLVHRDMKTYQHYLYIVCDEGIGTLQIVDMQYLPDSVVIVYDSNALFNRAHNIFIDTLNARLYTCGGNTGFGIYSLADPEQPTLLDIPEQNVPWWNSEIGYVHDMYARDNIAYLNDQDAMHIVDLTNANAPTVLGSLTSYPQPGYNHSGWLHDNGWLYVMADETHGQDLKLFDVSDPGDIQFIDTIGVDWAPTSIPHNPLINGNMLHVSYYYDGYWLWDVSDPSNSQVIGYYDTYTGPNGNSYKGAWGVYPFLPSGHVLVSDMQGGLFVFDIDQAVAVRDHGGELPQVRTWPNPTTGTLHVAPLFATNGHATITVLDVDGRTVLQEAPPDLDQGAWTVGLDDLPAGVYLLVIQCGDRVLHQRVVRTSDR